MVLPHLDGLRVDRVFAESGVVRIQAESVQGAGVCPDCGTATDRVHSRYQRRISDPAMTGRQVWIQVRVRRFFCPDLDCTRQTFAEQIRGLTVRHSRHSVLARQVLQHIAVAAGGRPGARLAHRLQVTVGRMTLIRLIRRLPIPEVGAPRFVGVDDFALRRGRIYGTVLVDLETHQPIDVLADREAATLTAWLQQHPGVEIICRDRAGSYAEGARTGAPQAIQIADRWHLWHNLVEAVEKVVIRHRHCLPEPAQPEQPTAEPATPASLQAERAETASTTRVRERYAAVQDLVIDKGVARTVAARLLNLNPDTVARYAKASTVEELLTARHRVSKLDPFTAYLDTRWNDGCTDAVRLTQEIRKQGFQGTDRTVRRYLEPLRAAGNPTAKKPTAPKVRHVVSWITRHPDDVTTANRQTLNSIRERCPHLHAAVTHVQRFATILCNLRGAELPQWLAEVEADDLPDLHTYTAGIRRDLDAVTNGLTQPWNSGQVEGTVTKIKAIKRSMFGRANFDLLRRRILLAD
ncbi:ISL3-like element IS469 family transposase [Dactylosporangium cerinum]